MDNGDRWPLFTWAAVATCGAGRIGIINVSAVVLSFLPGAVVSRYVSLRCFSSPTSSAGGDKPILAMTKKDLHKELKGELDRIGKAIVDPHSPRRCWRGKIVMAFFARNLHEWIPSVFSKPSASPFLDSFITVMSILATFYMVQKKIECWIIWLLVDIVGNVCVYFIRDLTFTVSCIFSLPSSLLSRSGTGSGNLKAIALNPYDLGGFAYRCVLASMK